MKKLVLPILIVIAFTACKKEDAAQPEPTYYYSDNVFNPNSNACIETADGNLAFATVTSNNSITIFKLTKTAALVWKRTYDLMPNGIFSTAIALTEDNEHNLYATGKTQQGPFIIKADSTGDLLWRNTYGLSGNEDPTCIIKTGDGGILVAGNEFNLNFYLLKITKDGIVLWQRNYPAGFQVLPGHLLENQQGNYVLTSISPQFNWLAYLTFNTVGDVVGDVANTVDGLQIVGNTIELADGSLITCGGLLDDNNNLQDFVFKGNSGGTQQWINTCGTKSNADVARYIVEKPNGGLLVAGTSASLSSARTDGHMLSLSATGDSLAFQYFASSINIIPTNIFKQLGGDNVIVGQTTKTNGTNGVFITNTNADGVFK